MTLPQQLRPAGQPADTPQPSPPSRAQSAAHGLTLIIVRPVPAGSTVPAQGQSAAAARLTVTHLAHQHTGHPVAVSRVPAGVPNLRAYPGAPPYWLVKRTPGTTTWILIPALETESATQQQIDRHVRRWTATGTFAHTSLSGLRDLMGSDYFYGAVAIHDLPHWNQA